MNAATRADLRRPDGTPVRALVVDDEPTLAELLSMALRYEGWDVRSAADGLGAVRQGREFRPDVVVLDVMLPDIDGFEVLRRLRADSPDVPVLFLTARDAVEDRVAGPFHALALRWHLPPGEDWALAGGIARGRGAMLSVEADAPLTLAIDLGWHSPAYGVVHPAPVLVARAARPVSRILTRLSLPPAVAQATESVLAGVDSLL